MNPDIDRYLTLAQGVSSHANAGTLDADTALRFCRVVLPALLVEMELARRVDARLSSMFPAPAADPKPCEATVCSSRWQEPEAKKAKKKAAKKPRKKKEQAK
jgi:hypothetical protein